LSYEKKIKAIISLILLGFPSFFVGVQLANYVAISNEPQNRFGLRIICLNGTREVFNGHEIYQLDFLAFNETTKLVFIVQNLMNKPLNVTIRVMQDRSPHELVPVNKIGYFIVNGRSWRIITIEFKAIQSPPGDETTQNTGIFVWAESSNGVISQQIILSIFIGDSSFSSPLERQGFLN